MNEVKMSHAPDCDICEGLGLKRADASYDGKTIYGSWAWMCEGCFKVYGTGLGLGIGQKIIIEEKQ